MNMDIFCLDPSLHPFLPLKLEFFVQEVTSDARLVKGNHYYHYRSFDDLFVDLIRAIECLSEFLTEGDKVFARITYSTLDFAFTLDISKIVFEYEKVRCDISKKGDVDFNGNVFFTIKPPEK